MCTDREREKTREQFFANNEKYTRFENESKQCNTKEFHSNGGIILYQVCLREGDLSPWTLSYSHIPLNGCWYVCRISSCQVVVTKKRSSGVIVRVVNVYIARKTKSASKEAEMLFSSRIVKGGRIESERRRFEHIESIQCRLDSSSSLSWAVTLLTVLQWRCYDSRNRRKLQGLSTVDLENLITEQFRLATRVTLIVISCDGYGRTTYRNFVTKIRLWWSM